MLPRLLELDEIKRMTKVKAERALRMRCALGKAAAASKQIAIEKLIAVEAARKKAAAEEEAVRTKKKLKVLSKNEIMLLEIRDLRSYLAARGKCGHPWKGYKTADLQNVLIEHEAARAEDHGHEGEGDAEMEAPPIEKRLPVGTRVAVSGSR